MRNYVSVPEGLYVLKTDLSILDNGGETKAYKHVSDPSSYELVNKKYFQPALQLDENTFLVTLIFK